MSGTFIGENIDEYVDYWSEQPEEEIRKLVRSMTPSRTITFSWDIGGTEFIVSAHYKQNSSDSLYNKVMRLLESEAVD